MIEIYCDDERQMKWIQRVISNAVDCPFKNTTIRCNEDMNCYLCVKENITWKIKENKNDR